MHPYIAKRLAQAHSTPKAVVDATPVLGFGDFLNARVATLGLNPSQQEFLSRNGNLLAPPLARLETLRTLELAELKDASSADYQKILDGCLSYFNGPNKYNWFARFEPILSALNVSYKSGTACHLDLFQTATKPVWSGLEKADRLHYIKAEGWFFIEQLATHHIDKILLNGRSVINAFVTQCSASLQSSIHTSSCGRNFEFFSGSVQIGKRHIEVRGWNLNIQSSHGVTSAMTQSIGALC